MVECPNVQLAFTNCLIVGQDLAHAPYVRVKGHYVFTTKCVSDYVSGSPD